MTRADRDEQLMRALHDKYAASLWSFVVRLTGGDRTRSQDVVQETMLRAWRNPSVLGLGGELGWAGRTASAGRRAVGRNRSRSTSGSIGADGRGANPSSPPFVL